VGGDDRQGVGDGDEVDADAGPVEDVDGGEGLDLLQAGGDEDGDGDPAEVPDVGDINDGTDSTDGDGGDAGAGRR